MLARLLLCPAVSVLLSGAAFAQDKSVQLPRGLAPSFSFVSGKNDKTGEIELTRTVPLRRDTKPSTPAEAVPAYQFFTTSFSVKKGTVYTTDGKKLEPAEALRRLEPGTVVLETVGAQRVDPAYLRAVKTEVLILATPAPPPRLPQPDSALPEVPVALPLAPIPPVAPIPLP